MAFFLGFCLVVSQVMPEKWALAGERLIPGDAAVTRASFSQMTQDLRNGASVGEAVEVFCRSILRGSANTD